VSCHTVFMRRACPSESKGEDEDSTRGKSKSTTADGAIIGIILGVGIALVGCGVAIIFYRKHNRAEITGASVDTQVAMTARHSTTVATIGGELLNGVTLERKLNSLVTQIHGCFLFIV